MSDVSNYKKFLAYSKLIYNSNSELIIDDLKNSHNYDEVYYFNKRSHLKIFESKWKLLFSRFRTKFNFVDLQFAIAIRHKRNQKEKGSILIIFKGTQEAQDWLTNITVKFQSHKGLNKSVHAGFYESFDVFRRTIKSKTEISKENAKLLNSVDELDDDYDIDICGHSLGGAIATLAGCFFCDLGVEKSALNVYTFGAPPIGKEEFCSHYKDKLNLYRVVNAEDPVPAIEKFTKLRHFGELIFLDNKKIDFHGVKDYEHSLEKMV